jgi:predicted phage-related endonuclease
MFREFSNISKSSKRIKDEHQVILERARVMDEIVKFSI